MILHSSWHDALTTSARNVATIRGTDPDAAEAKVLAIAALDRPAEREVDDSGFESREDRDAERFGINYDAEMDRYERGLGL